MEKRPAEERSQKLHVMPVKVVHCTFFVVKIRGANQLQFSGVHLNQIHVVGTANVNQDSSVLQRAFC